jgi:hypothetical protein
MSYLELGDLDSVLRIEETELELFAGGCWSKQYSRSYAETYMTFGAW